jgi:hypothetical protein
VLRNPSVLGKILIGRLSGNRPEGFMPALVALMEVPGIVVALMLASGSGKNGAPWSETCRELVTGRRVLLLLGGLVIAAISGESGFAKVKPFFIEPFQGVLVFFLLEMGLIAARHARDLRKVGVFLFCFAILIPLLHATIAVLLAKIAGLSLGGAIIFATMAASASYIAAPAAVRAHLPEANPGFYLTSALAVTFPFNLVVGIPLYHLMAQWIYSH